MRLLRTLLTTLALLGLSTAPAFAASSSQSTTVTAVVPATIACSGLAASYSGTLVPGTPPSPGGVNSIVMSGLDCSSNNATGFHITLQAGAPNFVGSGNPADTIADSSVNVRFSTDNGNSWNFAGALSTSPLSIHNSTAAGDYAFSLDNEFTIPASQPADSYSNSETLVGTTN